MVPPVGGEHAALLACGSALVPGRISWTATVRAAWKTGRPNRAARWQEAGVPVQVIHASSSCSAGECPAGGRPCQPRPRESAIALAICGSVGPDCCWPGPSSSAHALGIGIVVRRLIMVVSRGWARSAPSWHWKSRRIRPVISPSVIGGDPSGRGSSPRSRDPRSARARRRSWRALICSLWVRVASRSLAIDWLSCASRSAFQGGRQG